VTDTTPPNRLGNAAFVVALLGLLLAVIPGSAALGLVVCLFAVLPAFMAHLRCQKGRATNKRASTGALLAAPLGLVVAFAVAAANPISPVTTSDSATLASTASSPTWTPPRSGTPTLPTVQDRSARDPSTRSSSVRSSSLGPARTSTPSASPAKRAPVAAPKPRATVHADTASACDTSTHYINSSGNCVPNPVEAPVAPAGATAKCKDGEYSFSQHRSGTCSGHGGVAQWL
jgi:hypothetical protein